MSAGVGVRLIVSGVLFKIDPANTPAVPATQGRFVARQLGRVAPAGIGVGLGSGIGSPIDDGNAETLEMTDIVRHKNRLFLQGRNCD